MRYTLPMIKTEALSSFSLSASAAAAAVGLYGKNNIFVNADTRHFLQLVINLPGRLKVDAS